MPSRREVLIVPPPVEADLLRLVDGADDEAHADGQQLDFGQRHLDVARDHEALVEHAIEHVHETAAVGASWLEFGSHGEVPCSPVTGPSSKRAGAWNGKRTQSPFSPEHSADSRASALEYAM